MVFLPSSYFDLLKYPDTRSFSVFEFGLKSASHRVTFENECMISIWLCLVIHWLYVDYMQACGIKVRW